MVLLDLRGRSPVTEYFLIATGSSARQMRTVADELSDLGKAHGFRPLTSSGQESARWIVIDFVHVVAHIFDTDSRDFYDLELLWGDCPRIDWRKELGLPETIMNTYSLDDAKRPGEETADTFGSAPPPQTETAAPVAEPSAAPAVEQFVVAVESQPVVVYEEVIVETLTPAPTEAAKAPKAVAKKKPAAKAKAKPKAKIAAKAKVTAKAKAKPKAKPKPKAKAKPKPKVAKKKSAPAKKAVAKKKKKR